MDTFELAKYHAGRNGSVSVSYEFLQDIEEKLEQKAS